MIDMVAADGSLKEVEPDVPIEEQFPIKTRLTANIVRGFTAKMCIFRSHLDVPCGHHGHHTARHPTVTIPVYHYKWTKDCDERLIKKIEDLTKLDVPWRGELNNFLIHFKEHKKINLDLAGRV